ncbi:hypothetical protein [Actinoplanes sp. URMC 104]|uniref:hypothetical protein n=1 Tax=Actinoplanes sp. URMC 104 TaxID=3423409 RepID=UPI003F1E2B44
MAYAEGRLMWGANYLLRVYRDGTDEQVSQTGFWGQHTDDDLEALAWFGTQLVYWSPQYRLELQAENNGWTQMLKASPGSLLCGHDRRDLNGRCNDGSWCS